MGNVESGLCCGSYKVKQPEANLTKTENKKYENIESSQAKSTQVTSSSLSSFNKKEAPIVLETRNSLTTASSNNEIVGKIPTPNQSFVRKSIGQNIKILVKVQKVPLSQIDVPNTESNVTKREDGQSNFVFKNKECKTEDSPEKIIMRKEDFARDLKNTDTSGFYVPTAEPTEKIL